MRHVALITGASRGIGAATALVFAERGYRVVVNYRSSAEQADQVVRAATAAGGEAVAIRADVTAPDDVAAMVDDTEQRWGLGDHFQIPTVGIAVDPVHIPLDSPALQALVRANQRALRTIAEKPSLAVDYIASLLNRLTRGEAQQHYERYIGPYFTPDGQVDLNIAQQAVDAVAAELGVASEPADEIYQPAQ
jgi:NAD(P)-dependent dehydrogenase (short-subunit alcohol dehydrogenase family)